MAHIQLQAQKTDKSVIYRVWRTMQLQKSTEESHMQKNFMKLFVRSMKRTSRMLGTRRRLKRYKMSRCHVSNTYTACAQLQSLYHGVPRSIVEKFVSLCSSCQLRKPQLSTAPLKPIIANGFFCRLEVHIIVYCICTCRGDLDWGWL